MSYVPFTRNLARQRLDETLVKLENSNDFMLLDQAAFLLAHFQAAGTLPVQEYVKELPKLTAQVADCLPEVQTRVPEGRVGNLQAMMACNDYQNREDDLGWMATYLLKLVGGI